MRSELQYFMSQDDHAVFDDYLRSIDGVSIKKGENFDEILLDDGFIQYERSFLVDGILTSGRIAIASTNLDGAYNFSSHQAVESLYKKLRNWLKRRSVNSLVCFNEKSKNPATQIVKNFWLGVGAAITLNNLAIKLKQFKSGSIVFKLA